MFIQVSTQPNTWYPLDPLQPHTSWRLSKTAAGWWDSIPFPESVTIPSQLRRTTQKTYSLLWSQPSYRAGKSGSLGHHPHEPLYSLLGHWELQWQFTSYLARWWFVKRGYKPWPAVSNSSIIWSNTSHVFPSHWFHSSDPWALRNVSNVGMSSTSSAMSSPRIQWAVLLCLTVPEIPFVSEVPFIFSH